jgi:hypothetical protein
MSSNTPLLVLHLVGFALGVGGSTILDLRFLRLLRGKIVTNHDLALASTLSLFVRVGLALLWVSGLAFLLRLWLVAPEMLANPKLHAKIVIVVALTLNGVLIEMMALPLVRRQIGRPLFAGIGGSAQIAVLCFGVVSATSWYVAFLLGVVRELNFGPSAVLIVGVYLVAIVGGIGVALSLRRWLYRPAIAAARRNVIALAPSSGATGPVPITIGQRAA